MRKKAAKQTTKRRTGSSPEHSGLIAKGKSSRQSAGTKSALDNRSHRTTLQISCKRTRIQLLHDRDFIDVTMRANRLLPRRLTTSFA